MNIDRFGHNRDIEYHKFEQGTKKITRNFLVGFGFWWVLSTLFSFGLLGVFLYVAWHFLAKVW